ncbi:MAG: methyltransferase domain-containing protein [Planctomycetota bacterium]
MTGIDYEGAVRERYSSGAQQRVSELCCAVDYDPRYLEVIPAEILERDYGCGDPSRFVREGDRVLDLGSGTGKICYIAAQIVGPKGSVLGIDVNDDMLGLARSHQQAIGERIGFHNVTFRKAEIQDLRLDLEPIEAFLVQHPVQSLHDLTALEAEKRRLRREAPLVPDGSIDLVLSNCVLNLVRPDAKQLLFAEIFRVLAPGGRIAISDIVSDRDVPQAMQEDPELWSGCISGAIREDRFLGAFAEVGFQGIRIAVRGEAPWQVVEGIEFRSVTVTAMKPHALKAPSRTLLYRGPWAAVQSESGRTIRRGQAFEAPASEAATLTSEAYGTEVLDVSAAKSSGCCAPAPASDSKSSCC